MELLRKGWRRDIREMAARYARLRKPWVTPPGQVFGVVWTILTGCSADGETKQ